jgi:nucleoside-diphosphate-sugar epimerase
MIHVRDLAQLMICTLKGQMIDRFVMAVDKGNCKFKDIAEAISKVFSSGQARSPSDFGTRRTHFLFLPLVSGPQSFVLVCQEVAFISPMIVLDSMPK